MKAEELSQPEKKYIEIVYDPVTQGYLREYCLNHGFDLTTSFDGDTQSPEDFDFHTTVWFTTTEHSMENGSQTIDVTVEPSGFDLFGEDENTLVLLVSGKSLTDIREYFGNEYGMEDEWPDFTGHITLTYNHNGAIPNISLPDIDLVADTLNIKTQ